jgi:methyl-accepting chemotaxis protein
MSQPPRPSRLNLPLLAAAGSGLAAAISAAAAARWGLASGLALAALSGAAAFLLARRAVEPVERLARAAAGMARGELSQETPASAPGEVAVLAESFRSLADGVRLLVADLQGVSDELSRKAAEVTAAAREQTVRSSAQSAAVAETSTTATEIAQTSQAAARQADSVIEVATRADSLWREGQSAVEENTAGLQALEDQVSAIALSITDLSEQTLRIGELMATVKDVAEQSNVLALNAAIEAAKVGEAGGGFAVVASEMRKLAEQSRKAAETVRAILSEVHEGTRRAIDTTEEGTRRAHAARMLAETTGKTLAGLANALRESSGAAMQIAMGTREQTDGVQGMVAAVGEIATALEDQVEGARRIEAAAGSLSGVALRLVSLARRYRA